MNQEDLNFKVNLTYPKNEEYDYFTILERINLDEECQKDLSNNHGLIIKEPDALNKDVENPLKDSIFSSKFGRTLQDVNPYSNRYSCRCGYTQGAFRAVPNDANFKCPICHTEIKLVGDDFTYFGWIILKDKYCVIHPLMYETLSSFVGKDNLDAIIEPEIDLDSNGNPISVYDKRLFKKKTTRKFKKRTKLDETYAGIGMLGFRDKFDEIMAYFLKKKPNKRAVYDDIMENKSIIFTHSIPVYTTQLRPYRLEGKQFSFEKTNAEFNLLAKLAASVNKDGRVVHTYKAKNQLLWDMQSKISDLTTEIIETLKGKKGILRCTITGRLAFSSRSVIVPGTKLAMDEVTLPYYGLVILLEHVLVNIIQKSYNMSYAKAYKIWYYASLREDKRVRDIIDNLIKAGKVNVIINRNPTISYQSLLYQRVVECTDGYTMGVNIFSLRGMNADFDGDTLNILLLFNKEFAEACERVYSPRNAFCISRDDGLMNHNINIFKDTVINLNSFLDLGRDNYSPEQLAKIKALQDKYPQMIS